MTDNRPKCLVSVSGEPLLYRLFRQFSRATFVVIGDYQFATLDAYLRVVKPKVPYKLVRAYGSSGTLSGLTDAIAIVGSESPFALIWSDLFFDEPPDIEVGDQPIVAVTECFSCRWSVDDDGEIVAVPSDQKGIPGLFYFPRADVLGDIPSCGEFLGYMRSIAVPIDVVALHAACRSLGR